MLKAGFTAPRRPPQPKMQQKDGSLAQTGEENAGVFSDHFTELFGRSPQFDPTVIDMLRKLPVVQDLGFPADGEIHPAISKMHATTHGVSGLNAKLWKALATSEDGIQLIRQGIMHFWTTESVPDGWAFGLLSILTKNGDLGKPGN